MLRAFLDLLLPPLCLNCDEPVMQDQALCSACWTKVTFIAPPFCACCGLPFEVPMEAGTKCVSCLDSPPVFAAARSAVLYDKGSKSLILRFKHGSRHHPARGFARWMVRVGSVSASVATPTPEVDPIPDPAPAPNSTNGSLSVTGAKGAALKIKVKHSGSIIAQSDLIIPVPLHWRRLLTRRDNQAVILARALARETGLPMEPCWLRRIRATPSQGHLRAKARAANVAGAFGVPEKYHAKLKGKTILLVDDVLTTGATVNACARTLLAAGAVKVNVLTLARVKKDV